MRVSMLQEQFAEALAIAVKATDPKGAIPVLGNVLIRTDGAAVEIIGTDLATTVIVRVGAKVDKPGAITLPAKTITELVKNLSPERVDMVLDEATQSVNMRCGMADSNIKGISAEEFPKVNVPTEWDTELNALMLARMIKTVAPSAAKEESRPILQGIRIQLAHGCLEMATADGYRLTVMERSVENAHEFQVIPRAAQMLDFARLLTENKDVKLAFTDEHIHFQYENVIYSIMLLEGRFPDFHALIPQSYKTKVTVYTQDLLNACKRAEIFARDSNWSIRLNVTPSMMPNQSGELMVRGTSAERGDNEGIIDAEVDGDAVQMAFNAKYVLDLLNIIQTDRVVFQNSGINTPGLWYPEDESMKSVIMPMSVNR